MTIRKRVPSREVEDDYRMWLQQMAAGSRGEDAADYRRQIRLLGERGLVEYPDYALYLESKEDDDE